MRLATSFFILLVLLYPALGHSAGMALTENFNVIAPSETIAEAVAKQAEIFRKQAALEWLGKELPSGKGPAMITVTISADKDDGLTWPIDTPERKFHQIWLTTSADNAVGATLHHEVVHAVINTFTYPDFLPAWANEGIASQADEAARKESRQQIAAGWANDGRWPQLPTLFQASRIGHTDHEGYAAAASVAQFLASLGGKPKVIEFAKAGQQGGWDQAAHDCYGVRDVAELQAQWQNWVSARSVQDTAQASARSMSGSAAAN